MQTQKSFPGLLCELRLAKAPSYLPEGTTLIKNVYLSIYPYCRATERDKAGQGRKLGPAPTPSLLETPERSSNVQATGENWIQVPLDHQQQGDHRSGDGSHNALVPDSVADKEH